MSDFENYDKKGIKWVYSFDSEHESIDKIYTYRTHDCPSNNLVDLLDREKMLNQRERINLLYVGITRAREILILSAVEKKQKLNSWFQLVSPHIK